MDRKSIGSITSDDFPLANNEKKIVIRKEIQKKKVKIEIKSLLDELFLYFDD